MSNYYITPYIDDLTIETSDLSIDIDEMEKNVICLLLPKDSQRTVDNYGVTWIFGTNAASGLMITVQIDNSAVILSSGPKEEVTEFIHQYRKFIPEKYRLFLSSEGSYEHLELTFDTKDSEILHFMGYI